MHHVVFTATENYVPYAAVLMTSLAEQARRAEGGDCLRADEGFVFHLLTPELPPETREKLRRFESELSRTWPCRVQCRTVTLEPEYRRCKNYGSDILYYRLQTGEVLPPEVDRCLYLDVDMLALDDVRALLRLDLEDRILGVVGDSGSKNHRLKARTGKVQDIVFDEHYFNSGLVLFNLKAWRKEGCGRRCLELARDWDPHTPDQDILNAAAAPERRMELPLRWNFFTDMHVLVRCRDEVPGYLNCTREEFRAARRDPAILHYAFKPWNSLSNVADPQGRDVGSFWWETARRMPVFATELEDRRRSLENDPQLQVSLGYEAWKRSGSVFGLLTMPLLALFRGSDARWCERRRAMPPEFFGVSLRMGEAVLHARRRPFKAVNLPGKIAALRRNWLQFGPR